MECSCGFKFSDPGEFRNCEAFITKKGHSGIICPDCRKKYVKTNFGFFIIEPDSGENNGTDHPYIG